MELNEVVDINTILSEVNVQTREETLEKLAELLVKENYVEDKDKFLEAVYEREKEGVTGIGNLVAIPHGKSESVEKVGLSIAVLENEIDWPSLDDRGVKVVILIAVGDEKNNSTEHLKLLSLIARRLSNDEVVEQLINSKNKSEIVSILSEG
ncbi:MULTISPECIES: PTS sugar transporter subunit IIA [Mammaliicoccus]|uniref:PTS sugar transporter subunit IIA n=1 Tax=Mammaliicoccus TaxID=2803850 RepID=UPI001EFB85E8|nr:MULTISPECIES: fructose PTS transporter subunit IIA [Mammaliicoccus]